MLVSSGWLFSNDGIKEGGNLAFVTNLVTALGGKSIFFDEYHHGYGATDTLWSVSPWPVKCGLAQVAVALLLLVFSRSRRLKAPVPLGGEERSRAEYLTSMATLLQQVGATGVSLKQAQLDFRNAVCKRFGLPDDAPTAALVAAVRERSPALAVRVKTALDRTELLVAQGRPPANSVLEAVQSLHELRKRMEQSL